MRTRPASDAFRPVPTRLRNSRVPTCAVPEHPGTAPRPLRKPAHNSPSTPTPKKRNPSANDGRANAQSSVQDHHCSKSHNTLARAAGPSSLMHVTRMIRVVGVVAMRNDAISKQTGHGAIAVCTSESLQCFRLVVTPSAQLSGYRRADARDARRR